MNNEMFFLLGLIATIFIVIVIKRMKTNDYEFDERQIQIRGRAYKIGFMIMLFLAASFVFASTVYEELAAYGYIWNSFSMFVGLTVFAVYSIWNDAYLALKQSAKKNLILCVIVIACNSTWIIDILNNRITLAEMIQSYRAINIFCALTFAIIAITLGVKIIIDRKEEA